MTPDARDPLILLVEDDPALAAMVSDWFAERHYNVCHVDRASDAERALDEVQPNLIVLDLMLPDRNGLTMCSHLKERAGVPLIICSATRRKDDAVIGLQLGADDFLRKPFALDELQARVDLALRRAAAPAHAGPLDKGSSQELGALTIDTRRCVATNDGRPLPLTPTEFRLLRAVANRAPDVVARGELAESVWGAVDDGIINSLDVHMRRLRTKLRTAAVRMRLVTRRGFGYQLVDDADGTVSPRAPSTTRP
jgi:DNA-binding response OmpR family regulator